MSPERIQLALERCEARPAVVEMLWVGDRRSPCGERWLLDHAPELDAPPTPLGTSRMALRELTGELNTPVSSLQLHGWGLHSEARDAHLEVLSELDLPEGFVDPWLAGRLALQKADREGAALFVGALVWHPVPSRRDELLDVAEIQLDLEILCRTDACLWGLADELAEGAPGDRAAVHDVLWMNRGPRLAGLAGAWVASWKAWSPEVGPLLRPGIGTEPASALWVGGTPVGLERLQQEFAGGVVSIPVGSTDTPGGRAAAVVPWVNGPGRPN